jgi:hypothetical protein
MLDEVLLLHDIPECTRGGVPATSGLGRRHEGDRLPVGVVLDGFTIGGPAFGALAAEIAAAGAGGAQEATA